MYPRQFKIHLTILIFTAFILCCLQLFQIPVYDEAIWFLASAYGINNTGRPLMYCGENLIRPFAGHPPLFNYCVAFFTWMLGYSYPVLRLFNLICTLGTVVFIYLLLQYFLDEKKAFVGSLIIILNPYIINSCMLIDPDTSLLPLLSLGCIYFLLQKNYMAVRIFFSVMILSKLTQPLLMIPVIFLLASLNEQSFKKGSARSLNICLTAGMVYAAAQLAYSLYSGENYLYSLVYLFFKSHDTVRDNTASIFALNILDFFLRATPYCIFILAGIFLISRKNILQHYNDCAVIILAVTCSGSFLLYCTRPGFYPKYLLSSCIILMIAGIYGLLKNTSRVQILPVLFFCSLLFFMQFGDIAYHSSITNLSPPDKAPEWYSPVQWMLYALPALILFFHKQASSAVLTISLAASLSAVFFILTAPYSVKYFYGITGYPELLAYLSSKKDCEIICPTDIGVILKKRFFNNVFFHRDASSLDQCSPARIYCHKKFNQPRLMSPEQLQTLSEHGFFRSQEIGHFVLYEQE